MNDLASCFAKLLDEKGIVYGEPVDGKNGFTLIPLCINLKNTTVRVVCSFDGNLQFATLRIVSSMHVDEDQYSRALVACNELNVIRRWFKFCINKNNNVEIVSDMHLDVLKTGYDVFDMLMLILKTADETYPLIQEAIED